MNHQNTSQIRTAILKAWPSLPDEFRGWQVWGKVNKALPNMDVYNDTVLHTMREMNRRGLISYECVNRQDSLYRKVIHINSK